MVNESIVKRCGNYENRNRNCVPLTINQLLTGALRFGLLFLLFMILAVSPSSAQSFSEWFKQKKTQKKYLKAQIAGLATYMRALEKGYGIAKDGLATITALREGDYLQHRLHFSSMEMVSPRVRHYSKVLAIAAMEDKSQILCKEVLSLANSAYSSVVSAGGGSTGHLLNTQQLQDLRSLIQNTAAESDKDLKTLELLVSDRELIMTEDQRISHIDQLYNEVKKKFSDVLVLSRNLSVLVHSRLVQVTDFRVLAKLYGPEAVP